jgi:hypothetical protein
MASSKPVNVNVNFRLNLNRYVRVLQTPVVGMHDYVEERQRFILFLTGEAYDYINALPNSTFKASNE